MLPRIPLVDSPKDFWKFSKAGRALADLHINYESVSPYADVEVIGAESKQYTVTKMKFPKKDEKHTILYNGKIKITNIPEKAYQFFLLGSFYNLECRERKITVTIAIQNQLSTVKNYI